MFFRTQEEDDYIVMLQLLIRSFWWMGMDSHSASALSDHHQERYLPKFIGIVLDSCI